MRSVEEFQTTVKWWLSIDTPLVGHHATAWKHGGDVVLRNNKSEGHIVWVFPLVMSKLRLACSHDQPHSRSADILVFDWRGGGGGGLGHPAALEGGGGGGLATLLPWRGGGGGGGLATLLPWRGGGLGHPAALEGGGGGGGGAWPPCCPGLTVTSPLDTKILLEAGVTAGAAAQACSQPSEVFRFGVGFIWGGLVCHLLFPMVGQRSPGVCFSS